MSKYTPKVGDVLIQKGTNYEYTIVAVIAEVFGYSHQKENSVYWAKLSRFGKVGCFSEEDFIYPKVKFVPEIGDTYFFPVTGFTGVLNPVACYTYTASTTDKWLLDEGLVFKTESEAKEARKTMLNSLK